MTNEDRVIEMLDLLKRARMLALAAGALRTRERIRSAISSAKGALRHARNRDARARASFESKL